jgi:tetratricopeptide (TPR) repeat protein
MGILMIAKSAKQTYRYLIVFCSAIVFAFGATNAQTALQEGRAAFERGDYQEAIKALTQAIKLDPSNANAYALCGLAYANAGDLASATQYSKKACDLNNCDLLVELYKQGLWQDSPSAASLVNLGGANAAQQSAFDKGYAASQQGNYQEAIKQYTEALKIDPNLAQAYNNRGNAYAGLGDYKKAIADYAQAIKIDPNNAEAYYNRGLAYYNLGDTSKAITDWTQAIKIDPNLVQAYYNRGVAYAELGDYKSATKDARKACELGACDLLQLMTKEKLLRD